MKKTITLMALALFASCSQPEVTEVASVVQCDNPYTDVRPPGIPEGRIDCPPGMIIDPVCWDQRGDWFTATMETAWNNSEGTWDAFCDALRSGQITQEEFDRGTAEIVSDMNDNIEKYIGYYWDAVVDCCVER